jgi:hypothetical protein
MIGELLGKSLEEVNQLSLEELYLWPAFLVLKNEREAEARRKASKDSGGGKTMRSRPRKKRRVSGRR